MTPEVLAQLRHLQTSLNVAFVRSAGYQDALTHYHDKPHVWPSMSRWLSVRRLRWRLRAQHDEVMRISAVIHATVAVEALVAGPERGPIIRNPHSTRP